MKRGRYRFKFRVVLHHTWSDKPTYHYPSGKGSDNVEDLSKWLTNLVTEVDSITGGHVEENCWIEAGGGIWSVTGH